MPPAATDDRRSESEDTDAEGRQKAELKRLREEVLDIARELEGLRRSETGRAGTAELEAKPVRREAARETAAKAKPSGMSRSSKFAPAWRRSAARLSVSTKGVTPRRCSAASPANSAAAPLKR
ncbi:MAG: hypothetical protein K2X57_30325 [Xanthobacteraceae bacterium]|nr:hypothetical protein [Xanthobacteraceae bacterium]